MTDETDYFRLADHPGGGQPSQYKRVCRERSVNQRHYFRFVRDTGETATASVIRLGLLEISVDFLNAVERAASRPSYI